MSNIEEDIKRCKKLAEPQNANWIGISNQLAITHLIEKIKELEEENEILKFQNKQVENYVEELKKYNKTVSDRIVAYKKDSIPKQKIKDLLTEIQEEYNEVQEQFDCIWNNKKSKDDYDRYKLQEFSTMQQQLGFFIGKLEELLEDK